MTKLPLLKIIYFKKRIKKMLKTNIRIAHESLLCARLAVSFRIPVVQKIIPYSVFCCFSITLTESMSGYSRAFSVLSALFLLLATQAPDNASWYKEDDSPKDKGESFHEV